MTASYSGWFSFLLDSADQPEISIIGLTDGTKLSWLAVDHCAGWRSGSRGWAPIVLCSADERARRPAPRTSSTQPCAACKTSGVLREPVFRHHAHAQRPQAVRMRAYAEVGSAAFAAGPDSIVSR
jgi:hypothetical protein